MKHTIALVLIIVATVFQLKAQDSTLKASLDNKQFSFTPSTMMPLSGKSRQVTSGGYLLQLKRDTLTAYLPYMGKAYNAPINSSEAGINFTSTDFTYTVSEGKKNSYKVVIATKDRTYNSTFTLTVYDNGSAYLHASSSDKQSISYNGSVSANH